MENEKIAEYIEYLEGSIKSAIENVATHGDSTKGLLWEGIEVGYTVALQTFKEIMEK